MKRSVKVGDVFGSLTVIERDGSQGKNAMWRCRCSCQPGAIHRASGSNLLGGTVQSCGCKPKGGGVTHGMSGTRVYRIWHSMKNRCLLESDPFYHRYGGRGIRVCDEWLSFEGFYASMGEPPSDQHSIERRKTDGHYEPGNCRWATRLEQQNNRSTNRRITLDGVTRTVAEWARHSGIPSSTILERLRRGWEEGDAITRPSRAYGRREGA